jgi:hypothetical protein
LPEIRDHRGALGFAEWPTHLPFRMERVFFLHDLPVGVGRGGHAHRTCHQAIICLAGVLDLTVEHPSAGRQPYRLDSPRAALHLPPLSWVDFSAVVPGTVVLVLASHPYDPADYLTDRSGFLAEATRAAGAGKSV